MTITEMRTTDGKATTDRTSDRWELFERCRPRLHAIASRILRSADDAEDIVQETSLRWLCADIASVRVPEAWLVTVVTRLAIDYVRRVASEKQAYTYAKDLETASASDRAEQQSLEEIAARVSDAFHIVRERLAPAQRTALVLREAFSCDYDELARVLEKSETACRQIVHRARERLRGAVLRHEPRPAAAAELAERFVNALARDDSEAALAALHHQPGDATRSASHRMRSPARSIGHYASQREPWSPSTTLRLSLIASRWRLRRVSSVLVQNLVTSRAAPSAPAR